MLITSPLRGFNIVADGCMLTCHIIERQSSTRKSKVCKRSLIRTGIVTWPTVRSDNKVRKIVSDYTFIAVLFEALCVLVFVEYILLNTGFNLLSYMSSLSAL